MNKITPLKKPPIPGAKKDTGDLRIGEILIKEGFIKHEDLIQALAIQRKDIRLSQSSLGNILIETKRISQTDLNKILKHPYLKKEVGVLAIERGFITADQMDKVISKQTKGQMIGELLVKDGFLSTSDLKEILKTQINGHRIGELAIKLNLISQEDLNHALKVQNTPRAIGEILCEENTITPLDLSYALNKYKKEIRLGDQLVRLGFLKQTQLNEALQEQQHSTDTLGDILLRKKAITADHLREALSRQANIPFEYLDGFVYTDANKRKLSGIISQKFSEKNLMLPLSLKGKDLKLAFCKPEKIHLARELKDLYSNLNILCVLISEKKFSELFEILYSKRLNGMMLSEERELADTDARAPETDFMQIELDEDIETNRDAPIYGDQDIEAEEIVNYIIKYGIVNKASDIHIEQDRSGVKLRYRIDGVLRNNSAKWLNKRLMQKARSIVSRIKILSNLDIAEKRIPQDGVFRINYFDKTSGEKYDLDFRVATCRAIAGENVTIRILDPRNANIGLENLDHSPHVLHPFKRYLKSSAGMILVTGPTGSGKSSTLYGALQYLYNPNLKIITAEDPIEFSFPGIMQTQINPKIDLTFARLLRSFLRLDPDVILVGEIRDPETAKIGFDAAQTGHLVLSTLHTNDSISSISRLLDLGIDRAQITASVSCVLAQRLIRRICLSCIKDYVPEEEEWSLLFDEYPANKKFYKGSGCSECGFSGFNGRTLLSEIYQPQNVTAINENADIDELKRLAIKDGMLSMLDDGLSKLNNTTLGEILRIIPSDMINLFRRKHSPFALPVGKTGVGETIGPYRFTLSDPSAEESLIDTMHSRFTSLAVQAGHNMTIDRKIFSDFLHESFHDIRENRNCSRVIFHIEERNGRLEISGIPAD